MKRCTVAPLSPAENAAGREPARWERIELPDGRVRARCISGPAAPWSTGPEAEPGPWVELPALTAPRAPRPFVADPNTPALNALNEARARLGRDPIDASLSDAEIERRKGKIYEEHASYAIEIELPSCGCCGRVAARCPCPWRCTLPVGAPPATDRAPCACGAPAAARAA